MRIILLDSKKPEGNQSRSHSEMRTENTIKVPNRNSTIDWNDT